MEGGRGLPASACHQRCWGNVRPSGLQQRPQAAERIGGSQCSELTRPFCREGRTNGMPKAHVKPALPASQVSQPLRPTEGEAFTPPSPQMPFPLPSCPVTSQQPSHHTPQETSLPSSASHHWEMPHITITGSRLSRGRVTPAAPKPPPPLPGEECFQFKSLK